MMCAKGVDNYLVRTGPYAEQKVIVDGPVKDIADLRGFNMASMIDPEDVADLEYLVDH